MTITDLATTATLGASAIMAAPALSGKANDSIRILSEGRELGHITLLRFAKVWFWILLCLSGSGAFLFVVWQSAGSDADWLLAMYVATMMAVPLLLLVRTYVWIRALNPLNLQGAPLPLPMTDRFAIWVADRLGCSTIRTRLLMRLATSFGGVTSFFVALLVFATRP